MTRSRHRIGRLVFDFRMSDRNAAERCCALLRTHFDSAVLPAIAAACERIDRAGELIRFDRVELDLGRVDASRIDFELGPRLADELSEALQRQAVAAHLAIEDLIVFLDKGELPWGEAGDALASLAAHLLAWSAHERYRLAQQLAPSLVRLRAAERLAHQLPAAFVRDVMQALLPEQAAGLMAQTAASATPSMAPLQHGRAAQLAPIICKLARQLEPLSADEMLRVRTAFDGSGNLLEADLPTPAQSLAALPDRDNASDEHARPVHAAGAVLLHPFLAHFFERLGLTASYGHFRDHQAHCPAVLLTHHLATGANNAPEPETLLFKLLCGFPLQAPLPRRTSR